MSAAVQTRMSDTPYLDRQRPLPRANRRDSKIKTWQTPFLFACLLVKTMLILYVTWMFVIFIHEVGHLVVGIIVGDAFDFIRVGCVEFDGGKVKWDRRWSSLLTGETRTLPKSKSGLRWRLFLSTIAGPASNLLTGYASFTLAKPIPPGQTVLLLASLYVFSVQSLLVGSVNLVPALWHGTMNDGMRLYTLLFSRKRSERLISILRFLADVKQGIRPPIAAYELDKWASVSDQTADQVVANWAAYRKATDVETEAGYLDKCLASCSATSSDFREELIVQAASFQALRRNRIDLAREWLADDKSGKKRVNRFYVEAVILRHEGTTEQVIAKIDETLSFLAANPDNSLRTEQENAFKKWRVELEGKLAGKSTVQHTEGV